MFGGQRKSQRITKVSMIHPLGNMNVCTEVQRVIVEIFQSGVKRQTHRYCQPKLRLRPNVYQDRGVLPKWFLEERSSVKPKFLIQ